MKDTILVVLKYIVENYSEVYHMHTSLDDIHSELSLLGFTSKNMSRAIDWLENLNNIDPQTLLQASSYNRTQRIYSAIEDKRLAREAKGFLIYLENKQIINEKIRELIIDQAMSLEVQHIDLEILQWVSLMVLIRVYDEKLDFADMENVFFSENPVLH